MSAEFPRPGVGGSRPLRAAILGCGQIADAHLQELQKLPGIQVVAVCDRLRDLAWQAAARFKVPAHYDDLSAMLSAAAPDVVHVTTPAHTHGALACELLSRGVHTYVEKPFTLEANEAAQVVAAAEAAQRLVTVGHDQLFDPTWTKVRQAITAGRVGAVRHVESVLGYPLSGQFGRQVQTDPQHWVHRLPGGLFQNTISHPLYRILDLLPDANPSVQARWWRSGDATFPTELRAELTGQDVTGSLVFSTRLRPCVRITRVFGERGFLEVDFDTQVIRFRPAATLPGALGKVQEPFRQWREAAKTFRGSVWRFLRSDMHYFAGMRELFRAFYAAIDGGGPPPIAYAEIVRVTRIMDEMFASCRAADESTVAPARSLAALSKVCEGVRS